MKKLLTLSLALAVLAAPAFAADKEPIKIGDINACSKIPNTVQAYKNGAGKLKNWTAENVADHSPPDDVILSLRSGTGGK